MIRRARPEDTIPLAIMLKSMYCELFPEHAVEDDRAYFEEIRKQLDDEKVYTYVENNYKGFLIIRDETEDLTPTLHRFNLLRIYIKPDFRKSRTYWRFYKKVLEDFPDGDVLGMTEANSEHNIHLRKRQEVVATIYKLRR
jgi:hypothetical protein